MKYISYLVLSLLFLLQACDGASSILDTGFEQFEDTHTIQPSDVPQYVENFKQQQSQLRFSIGSKQFTPRFLDEDRVNQVIYATYSEGLIVIGFDFDQDQPTADLSILEGDLGSLPDFEVDKQWTVEDIVLSEDASENFLYNGLITDQTSFESFDVNLLVNESLITSGNTKIELQGSEAFLVGDAGTLTYIQIQDLIDNHPEVSTLVLASATGSVNDAINMHTGRLIRTAQLTTEIPSNGEAYSGGVDLFTAGFRRKIQPGAIVGVHSWCCTETGKAASELSRTDSAHNAQLTYFREMLGSEIGPDFYFFTIDSADFNDIHNMSDAEIERFGLVTDF